MIATDGNIKYKPGEIHSRCDECLTELIEHGELMIMFNNDYQKVLEMEKMIADHKKSKK